MTDAVSWLCPLSERCVFFFYSFSHLGAWNSMTSHHVTVSVDPEYGDDLTGCSALRSLRRCWPGLEPHLMLNQQRFSFQTHVVVGQIQFFLDYQTEGLAFLLAASQ